MKLIVGLGNPGKEYQNTRHNAGFLFIDFLAKNFIANFTKKFQSEYAELNINGEKVILLKPQTFMNSSGNPVSEASRFYKLNLNDIFVAFDDLDLAEGEFKVQKAKYPKIHNGVNDIIEKLGSDQINFIRIGIDNRTKAERDFISGQEYVLQKLSNDLHQVFEKVLEQIHFLKLNLM